MYYYDTLHSGIIIFAQKIELLHNPDKFMPFGVAEYKSDVCKILDGLLLKSQYNSE